MRTPHVARAGRTVVLAALIAAFGPAGLIPAASAAPQIALDCFVAECPGEVIDFNSMKTGEIVSTVFGSGNTGPIFVHGINPAFGALTNAAVVFDSANPTSQTGNDDDLGTPNEDFGGPGVGAAGEEGEDYANALPQCKVLIIDEWLIDVLPGPPDGLVDLPDDADNPNATFTFDFSEVGPVTVYGMTVIDVEAEETNPAMVEFLDAGDSPVAAPYLIPAVGDNGIARLAFGNGVSGVVKLVVTLGGSGAIDDICFEPDEQSECEGSGGDFVWFDRNCNGWQDPDEPGIEGVVLVLRDRRGKILDVTRTDEKGFYLFEGLCEGCYLVSVRRQSVPQGMVPTICWAGQTHPNDGNSSSTDHDSNCPPAHLCLPTDESRDVSIDFGFKLLVISEGQGCSHGYWKGDQHHDSWPAPFVAAGEGATLFSDVFEDAFPGMTLQQVLEQGGGGLNALGREAVAALLNAASGMSYGLTIGQVVPMFDDLHPQADANDYEPLKDIFEGLNTQGCPLD